MRTPRRSSGANTMALTARLRWLAFLVFALLNLIGTAHAQLPLIIEPKALEIASTVTLTVTSNGAFDLSRITARQVNFRTFEQEPFEERDIQTVKVDATARKLTVTAAIPDRRIAGDRLMDINFGDMIVSLKFTLAQPFVCPASCQPPRMCVNKICVLPPSKCNPRCQLPRVCNEERKRCEIAQ